jgi:hypothetical protein
METHFNQLSYFRVSNLLNNMNYFIEGNLSEHGNNIKDDEDILRLHFLVPNNSYKVTRIFNQ